MTEPRRRRTAGASGLCPSPTSFLVTLSITAMWSASNACLAPSVYAVRPRATPNAAPLPSVTPFDAVSARSPNPTACRATSAAASGPTAFFTVRSLGRVAPERAPTIRRSRMIGVCSGDRTRPPESSRVGSPHRGRKRAAVFALGSRDEGDRALGERGDRQRRVDAGVRRHRRAVGDQQVLVAEDAVAGVDDALARGRRRSPRRRGCGRWSGC